MTNLYMVGFPCTFHLFFIHLTEFLGMLVSSYVLIRIFVGISERCEHVRTISYNSPVLLLYTLVTLY